MATFKQKYLHQQGPFPFNFQQQRQEVFQRILHLIISYDINSWLTTGLCFGPYIQMFKQIYGLTSLQKQTLLNVLMNYVLCDKGVSVTVQVALLNSMIKLCQNQVKITKNFSVNNTLLLNKFRDMANKGTKMPLKHVDAFMQNYCKFVLYISKFGDDCTQEALQLSIDKKDLRFLAIFIRSLKSQESAQKIIDQIFVENSVFERDIAWFYILDYITNRFPRIDYSPYYQTIFQQIIKSITKLMDPYQDQIKKITQKDLCVGLKSILKSCAGILVNLIQPSTLPNSDYVWSCIQRIFNMIQTSCDHINQTYFIYDFFLFLKTFLKGYLVRFRKQHKLYKSSNQDTLEYDNQLQKKMYDENQEDEINNFQNSLLPLDQKMELKFDSLWQNIFPKLLLFQQNQCWLPKILSDLSMYKKQVFLTPILQQILKLTQKQDVSLISYFTSKMTILYLQQFIITQGTQEQLTLLIQCLEAFLDIIQKLGVSQNLDMLQLVIRVFIYLKQDQINSIPVQSLIQDIINIILESLDPMSINLENAADQQAQLYIDFKNIFYSFFLILDQKQIQTFTDKFLYKISENIPTHRQAYEFIAISLSFVNSNFAGKVMKKVWKQLIVSIQYKNKEKINEKQNQMIIQGSSSEKKQEIDCYPFLKNPQYTLSSTNEQKIKWLISLIQCSYQYNSQNIIKDWQKLETICILLLKQKQNQNFYQWGLDTLYNLIIGIAIVHIDKSQFLKRKNWNYKTMNIQWKHMSQDARNLIKRLYQKYYIQTKKFIMERYGKVQDLHYKKNQKTYKIGEQILPGQISSLVDGILISNPMSAQALDQKKIISRCLSLQQTFFSAIITRLPPSQKSILKKSLNYQKQFLQEYKDLRKDCCQYLQYILNVIGEYNMLWNTSIMKIFHYFWKEAHQQASMSSSISATNDKINPYFYPTQHTNKQLFKNSFLIINQCYLLHYSRIELNLNLFPINIQANPNYLMKSIVFDMLHQNLQVQNCLRTFNSHIENNLHQYHRILIAIFRAKLDPNEQHSYSKYYLNMNKQHNQSKQKQKQKQKYLNAIRSLLVGIKRCQYFFSVKCCIQDSYIRESIINIIQCFKVMKNKKDKLSILETFYLKLNFNLELKLIQDSQPFQIFQKIQNQEIKRKKRFSYLKNQKLIKIHNPNINGNNHKQNGTKENNEYDGKISREQKNKKSYRQIVQFIEKAIQKLEEPNLNKNSAIYITLALIYSTLLDLNEPVIGKILKFSLKFCDSGILQLIDIGRVAFFHVIYRFARKKQIFKKIINTPKKMPYQKFLYFRMLGGPQKIDYVKIKCDRLDSYFYPLNELTQAAYLKLFEKSELIEEGCQMQLQNEKILLSTFNSYQTMLMFFRACTSDLQLKNSSQIYAQLAEDEPKTITSNAHKLVNFIYDSNPQKVDIFLTFIQNFSSYPMSFYPRMIQKIVRLGNKQTISNLKKISKQLKSRKQIQYQKISLYIASQIIPSLLHQDKEFVQQYLEEISSCSNEMFSFALQCLYFLFCTNFLISANIYKGLIQRLRQQKGSSRFRHLQVFNIYVLAQGRFARNQAKDTIVYLLQGIQQGATQVAQAIVSMIVSCFVIAINLDIFEEWVQQPLYKLIQQKKIYRLNQRVGFQIDDSLKNIINQITIKAKSQQDLTSNSLKIYTKIVNEILNNITIHRFNDTFYDTLKGLIMYIVNKPAEIGQDGSKNQIIGQLRDSQYPEHIYKDIMNNLVQMEGNVQSVVKKKLSYIEGITINRCFVSNKAQIPDILSKINEKQITLDHINAISNIARLMTPQELCQTVQKTLKIGQQDQITQMKQKQNPISNTTSITTKKQCLLMAFLQSAGVKAYDWKQSALKQILKNKKKKLVREFIHTWWKGKGQKNDEQERLEKLIKSVETPYIYFA